MRCVVQRVKEAAVTVAGEVTGKIGPGLMILIGVREDDTEKDLRYMAEKAPHLRIFEDEAGKMNRSVLDIGGAILAVSQFTLYGSCKKGRRPDFFGAAAPEKAEALYERFLQQCETLGYPPQHGMFGAHMMVESVNDGPVTLIVDSKEL